MRPRTLLVFSLLALPACGRWAPLAPYGVHGTRDPDPTFAVVDRTLAEHHYEAVLRNRNARTLVVRAHIDRDSPLKKSWITVHVEPSGAIVLAPGGVRVRTNNTVHPAFLAEIRRLESTLAAAVDEPYAGLTQGSAFTTTSDTAP